MIKPAKMLPIAKRLIGLIKLGLFSFGVVIGWNRGCPRNTKKIIRVL